jgi:hypothetical protein
MDHVLVLRARPESFEPGLYFPDFLAFRRIPLVYEAGGSVGTMLSRSGFGKSFGLA